MSSSGLVNHYKWLDQNLNKFAENLGYNEDLRGLISAHGDKCYSYRVIWQESGIPFNHGVALYLLTYIPPYCYEVRDLNDGSWVSPENWVIDNYKRFLPYLPSEKLD